MNTVWTKAMSDEEVQHTLQITKESLRTEPAEAQEKHWCFVEGPTLCEFVVIDTAIRAVSEAWLVRVFAQDFEFFARRTGFEQGKVWLTRFISCLPPTSSGWLERSIQSEKTTKVLLYGKANNGGKFVEGTRFRDAFEYPHVKTPVGEHAGLLMSECQIDEEAPIVRWLALEQLETRAAVGLINEKQKS